MKFQKGFTAFLMWCWVEATYTEEYNEWRSRSSFYAKAWRN